MLKGYNSRQIERAEGDLKRGFRTTGLWAWSRHPVRQKASRFGCGIAHASFSELYLRATQLLDPPAFHPSSYRTRGSFRKDLVGCTCKLRSEEPHLHQRRCSAGCPIHFQLQLDLLLMDV